MRNLKYAVLGFISMGVFLFFVKPELTAESFFTGLTASSLVFLIVKAGERLFKVD